MTTITPLTRLLNRGLIACVLAAVAACGPGQPPPAPEVLASMPVCALPTGVHLVESMAGLTRGLYGNRIEPEQTSEAVPGGLRAVIVVAGDKPSAGYSLQLEDARYVAGTLTLQVRDQAPADDAITAAVMTRPCLAVGLPGAGYERLVVRDGTTTLATLDMRP